MSLESSGASSLKTEVYIAGPMFNREENSHNIKLANQFRKLGYDVFNPIEDGILGADAETLGEDELIRTIFHLDRDHIVGSRIFVANLNGMQVDDGTATEIGIAFETQKQRLEHRLSDGVEVMIGYFNDWRANTRTMRRNPLPFGPFFEEPNVLFANRKNIVEFAKHHYPPKNASL